MVKNPPARRTPGSNTWVKKISWKRELGGGYPLQYSCLENSMDRGI